MRNGKPTEFAIDVYKIANGQNKGMAFGIVSKRIIGTGHKRTISEALIRAQQLAEYQCHRVILADLNTDDEN